jgi:hypothetical protein
MATAGAVIASATVVEEVIVAEAARRPAAAVLRAAAGQNAPAAVARFTATQRLTIQAVRVPVQVTQQRHMQLLHMAAAADIPVVAAAADMPAVVVDMKAAVADIGNL